MKTIDHPVPMLVDFALLLGIALLVPHGDRLGNIGLYTVLLLALFWLVLGTLIGDRKGIARAGAWLGFLLGGFGVILLLAMRGDRHECPYCRSLVRAAAEICPFCENSQPHAMQ